MMNPNDKKDKKEESRPIAYPKPTEADKQLQNQPEFIDEEPSTYNKEISNMPERNTDSEA